MFTSRLEMVYEETTYKNGDFSGGSIQLVNRDSPIGLIHMEPWASPTHRPGKVRASTSLSASQAYLGEVISKRTKRMPQRHGNETLGLCIYNYGL